MAKPVQSKNLVRLFLVITLPLIAAFILFAMVPSILQSLPNTILSTYAVACCASIVVMLFARNPTRKRVAKYCVIVLAVIGVTAYIAFWNWLTHMYDR